MSKLNAGATVAMYDVSVERRSTNIAQALPFVLFGQNVLQTGYQSVLPLPNGLDVDVSQGTGADLDKILFTYEDGSGNTDVIALSSATAQYPDALAATITDLTVYDKIKLTLSSNMDTSQFNERVEFIKSSLFGSRGENNIVPSSQVTTQQNQDRQVDLPVTNKLDAKRAILSRFQLQKGIIQFNFFVVKTAIWNASALSRL
jgi:hypothetical protein